VTPTGGAPAVDRRGLGATPVADDPLARRLLQRAQGAMQKWPEGFRGFQARLRCRDEAGAIGGEARVFAGGRVESTLPPGPLTTWAEASLRSLARARTPGFFKDGDGRFPITLDPDDAHPRGRRVRVHADDPGARAYRIDAKGRLGLEERHESGRRWVVVTYDEFVRTCPGRYLPARLRIFTWDLAADTLVESADIEDATCRVDHVWLPARRRAVLARGLARRALVLELDGHTLL
jgi:hypothetical protein